jgi:hypothetical protein
MEDDEQPGKYSYPVEWEDGLVEVDAIGTGCIMIAREVFEKMDPPYFYYPMPELEDGSINYLSEDWGFSFKCQELDIPMHVDTTTTSPHITEALIDETTFRNHMALEVQQGEVIERADGHYERIH